MNVIGIKGFNIKIMEQLIGTALGREKADLIIKNATLINVYTGELLGNVDIAVKSERIAYVGRNADHTMGLNTQVINAKGKYVAPGFMDAHVHIESSMLMPLRFSEAVLPHGTTTVFIDPHEIANVLGIKGVKYFIEEAKMAPIRIFINIPSCVPATPNEITGGILNPYEVKELLKDPMVTGLAEVMDFHGVLTTRKNVLEKIVAAHELNKIVDGHAPGLSNRDLQAYVTAGITSDHESTEPWEVIEKARLGMYVMLREGSAWRDLDKIIEAILKHPVDTHMILFASDDRSSLNLLNEGHMDFIVRKAISLGLDPIKAIQMATINIAKRFKVDNLLGGIAPSKLADIIIIDDLKKINVKMVFVGGKLLAENGKSLWIFPKKYKASEELFHTMNVKRKILPEDFKIRAPIREGNVKVRVIGIIPNKAVTRQLRFNVKASNGEVKSDIKKDVLKIAMVDRYTGSGKVGIGLVHGFGFKYGALASSIAHDNHNILVVGVSEEDMAFAVNKIVEIGGGIIFAADGKIRAVINLPIAGILSNEPAEIVAKKLEHLINVAMEAGSQLNEPHMTLSILGLTVIPELRITHRGLFDVNKNKIVNIFVE